MSYTHTKTRRNPLRTTNTARPTNPIPLTAHQEALKTQLMAYNGMFSFLLDLRSKLIKYHNLSDKQWAAVEKCLKNSAPVSADPTVIAVNLCDVPITVSPTAARFLAKKHSWPINPTTLVVTQIKNKQRKGYTVRVKADWSGNVSVCRCCNRALTDWRSQATGVGPHCVKRTNIQYVRNQQDIARFQKEMQDLCASLGEVEVFLKGWGIVNGADKLNMAISQSTPTKAPEMALSTNKVTQLPYQWCDWHSDERILTAVRYNLSKLGYDDKSKVIDVVNSNTGNTQRFIETPITAEPTLWKSKHVNQASTVYVSTTLETKVFLIIK